VSYPFSDAAWAALDALGEKGSTASLRATTCASQWRGADLRCDRRLSVRGVEHGRPRPTKRMRADELIRRFSAAPCAGRTAALRPGQMVSRRGPAAVGLLSSLAARRQTDFGHDAARIASETAAARPRAEDSQRFRPGAGKRLGFDSAYAQPAFEDPAERMLRARAPGPGTPAGYVLPVQRWTAQGKQGWVSEIVADAAGKPVSRAGEVRRSAPACRSVRCPLFVPSTIRTSCRPTRCASASNCPIRRLFAQPLPTASTAPTARDVYCGHSASAPVLAAAPASGVPVRTALTVEPREGRLCVFMPPLERLEDYPELIAAIEATAAELETAVHVEGYEPPTDPRLNVIKVTPDPGVSRSTSIPP